VVFGKIFRKIFEKFGIAFVAQKQHL